MKTLDSCKRAEKELQTSKIKVSELLTRAKNLQLESFEKALGDALI
jgi:hypothetical protein